MDLIRRNAGSNDAEVPKESDSEVDDYGLEEDAGVTCNLECVLHPKIDQVTWWNSIYMMGVRLLALRVPIEMWYVNQ